MRIHRDRRPLFGATNILHSKGRADGEAELFKGYT